MFKIAAPKVSFHSFEALWALVGKQVSKEKAVGQRNHRSRIAGGRAKHTQASRLGRAVPSTQAVIHLAVVKIGKRTKPANYLVDGYHRLTEWFDHGCPFEALTVIEHQLTARDGSHAIDEVDALMRTIDSKAAVKGPKDFFMGAIGDAKLDVQSKAYKNGTNALEFFKRVIGSEKLSARVLLAQFSKDAGTHLAMDELYSYAESRSVMTAADRKRVFHAGVAEAVFYYMVNNRVSYKHVLAIKQVLAIASESPVLKTVSVPAVVREVGETLRTLASVSESKRLRSGRNPTQFCDAFRDEFAPSLLRLNSI